MFTKGREQLCVSAPAESGVLALIYRWRDEIMLGGKLVRRRL